MSDSWVCSMSHGHCSPQGARQLVEADVLLADRCGEARDVDRGEVVGVDGLIELRPGGLDELLVVGAEGLQDDDPLVAVGALDGELDVAQNPVGMSVGNEQWPAFAGGGGGEVVPVDQSHTGFDRVDAEPRPGDVEKRHRGHDVDVDAVVARCTLAKVANGALEHERRAGHGVQNLAVLDARRRRAGW